MKILFHHRIASTDGQFVHMYELTKALRIIGCDVKIVGPELDGQDSLGETTGLVKRLKAFLPKSVYELLEFAYTAIAAFRLYAECKKYKPDAIYERYNLHLHAGRFVSRWFKIPFLLEVNAPLVWERSTYGGLSLQRFAYWSEANSWNSADHVLPVTDVLADHLRKAGVANQKITVIPNGADLSLYSDANREIAKVRFGLEGKVVLGFVGFIRDWHGLSDLIKWIAVDESAAHCVLYLVGDGPDRKKLQDLSNSLGISDRIFCTGFVAREKVPSYIQSFDIALQPAVTPYASPLKLFEYLAASCAVASTGTRNMQEVLTDNVNCLMSTPDDPKEFGNIVKRLIKDAELRERLGKQARSLVESKPYTWIGNAEQVVNLIKLTKTQTRR